MRGAVLFGRRMGQRISLGMTGHIRWYGEGIPPNKHKAQPVPDAEISEADIPMPPVPEGMRKTNPFEATWQEKWVPNTPQILNIFVGVVMLGTVLKVARDRGENIEKEKRTLDRIEATKLEIEELKDRLPNAVADAILVLPPKKRSDPAALRDAVSRVTEDMIASVKVSAIARFEASLWDKNPTRVAGVDQEPSIVAPVPTPPSDSRAPQKDTRMY